MESLAENDFSLAPIVDDLHEIGITWRLSAPIDEQKRSSSILSSIHGSARTICYLSGRWHMERTFYYGASYSRGIRNFRDCGSPFVRAIEETRA